MKGRQAIEMRAGAGPQDLDDYCQAASAPVHTRPKSACQHALCARRQFQEEVQERARKEISQSREAAGTASAKTASYGTAGTVSSGGGAYASPTTMTMQGGRASSNGAPSSGTRQAIIATPPDLQVILFCACSDTA